MGKEGGREGVILGMLTLPSRGLYSLSTLDKHHSEMREGCVLNMIDDSSYYQDNTGKNITICSRDKSCVVDSIDLIAKAELRELIYFT